MHIRIDIFGYQRIQELYEEGRRKDAKIAELEKAIRFKQTQHKGYGKELAKMLEEVNTYKRKLEVLAEDRDEWARRYQESEKARKSLGEKLEKAMSAIELIRGGASMTDPSASMTDPSTPMRSAQDDTPSAQCEHWAPPPKGEARDGGMWA